MFFERTKNKIAPHHMMRVLYLFGTTPDQQCPKLLSSAVVPFGSCSDDRGDLTKTLLITTATSIFGKKDNLCVPKRRCSILSGAQGGKYSIVMFLKNTRVFQGYSNTNNLRNEVSSVSMFL